MMIQKILVLVVVALCAVKGAVSEIPAQEHGVVENILWESGKNGYQIYRIPAIAVTSRGTILAFCEGRKRGGSDSGDIDLLVKRSADNGKTWSQQLKITADVKLTNWTWYATGPGSGLQVQHGPHKGRMVIPCDHIEADSRHYYSHVIYSDDHGKSWALGGSTPQHQVNECEAVELGDGRLMLNMRNYNHAKKNRQLSIDGSSRSRENQKR